MNRKLTKKNIGIWKPTKKPTNETNRPDQPKTTASTEALRLKHVEGCLPQNAKNMCATRPHQICHIVFNQCRSPIAKRIGPPLQSKRFGCKLTLSLTLCSVGFCLALGPLGHLFVILLITPLHVVGSGAHALVFLRPCTRTSKGQQCTICGTVRSPSPSLSRDKQTFKSLCACPDSLGMLADSTYLWNRERRSRKGRGKFSASPRATRAWTSQACGHQSSSTSASKPTQSFAIFRRSVAFSSRSRLKWTRTNYHITSSIRSRY